MGNLDRSEDEEGEKGGTSERDEKIPGYYILEKFSPNTKFASFGHRIIIQFRR